MKDRSQKISNQEVQKIMAKAPHLKKQSYHDIPTLSPYSPQVISRQATVNIGTIGHVAHGKSTVVQAISGKNTVRFKQEKVRNITIRLGYANAKIYKCSKCKPPDAFKSYSSDYEDQPKCNNLECQQTLQLVRHVSFVDCPGHDILLSTMLTGAAVMDSALLLIAANIDCPQPQTSQHLVAVDIMKLDNIIILQNKIDIIFNNEQKVLKNANQIKKFIKQTRCQNSPIIPISAALKYNIDVICQMIYQYIPVPIRDLESTPKLIIIRSFDVNKPGVDVEQLQGGVVGGSILKGILKLGDQIEIKPGRLIKNQKGQNKYQPIKSKVVSLYAQDNNLLYAVPGGLIGVGLLLDPSLTRNDRLIGNLLGYPNQLPQIYSQICIKFYLLKRLLGVKTQGSQKQYKIAKLATGQTLKFNVGSTDTPGKITKVKDDIMTVQLNIPICTQLGQKVAFNRRIDKKYRLIGWGIIKTGKKMQQE